MAMDPSTTPLLGEDVEIIELLLSHGANVNAIGELGERSCT